MAESVLPASLGNLRIDPGDGNGSDVVKAQKPSSSPVNPFSYVGGARKKLLRKSDPGTVLSCPLSLFGKKCSKMRSDSDTCKCNRYIPSILNQKDKHLIKVKQSSIFKRSTVLRKSKLNFVKFRDANKQCDHSTGRLPLFEHRPRRNTWSSNNSSEDLPSSKDSNPHSHNIHDAGLLFGDCTANRQDFHSLISPSEKQLNKSSPEYQSTSFRSLQFLPAKRFHRRSRKLERRVKQDDDDGVDKVSTKLAVTGISSATCSQQARLTANAYCDEHDISIDELAGYFEDFVHIPKKMSLMAEQMYN